MLSLPFVLKALHILGATLFFGTGLGSAWYKLRAARSGDPRVVAWVDAEVVRADWVFTVPAGLAMPITGLALATAYGMSWWDTPWIRFGLVGYAIAGLTWLPAAALQLRMRRLSAEARDAGTPLPAAWHDAQRLWMWLGVPSFSVTVLTVFVMVSKRLPW